MVNSVAEVALAAGIVASILGCDPLLDANDSCAAKPSLCFPGGSSGGTPDPEAGPWDCVGSTQQLPDPIQSVTYSTNVVTIANTSNGALDGLVVSLCNVNDIPTDAQDDSGVRPCNMPLDVFLPDASASIGITLPPRPAAPQFDTFIAFESSAIVPVMRWFNRPLAQNTTSRSSILAIDLAHAAQVASTFSLQNAFDPTLGIVILDVYDCTGRLAAGVHATLQPGNPSPLLFDFTFQNGLVTTVPENGGNMPQTTDSSGIYGFANVQPGPSTVTLSYNGAKVGTATFKTRDRWGTGVDFRP